MALETLKNSFALFYDSKQHVGMVFLPLHFETRSVSLFGALNSKVSLDVLFPFPHGNHWRCTVGRHPALFTYLQPKKRPTVLYTSYVISIKQMPTRKNSLCVEQHARRRGRRIFHISFFRPPSTLFSSSSPNFFHQLICNSKTRGIPMTRPVRHSSQQIKK